MYLELIIRFFIAYEINQFYKMTKLAFVYNTYTVTNNSWKENVIILSI